MTSFALHGAGITDEPLPANKLGHGPRHLRNSVADAPDIVQRALCVVAALGLLILAANNFGVGVGSPWRAQISPLGFAFALGLVVASCSVRSARALNGVMLAVLGVAIALTAAETATYVLARHGFGIDEGAFVQYGTRLLLKGLDPFTHSMAPGFQLYGPPPVPTALTNGSISAAYDYPSLPLLLNVPFYWLTNGLQSVSVAAVFFQCAAAAVLFAIFPGRLRPLAVIVVFELPLLFGFEMGGSFYTMLLPFAVIAVWKWTDIGKDGHLSRSDLGRAVCLGLACAIEQIVWVMALFLILGIWRAGSRRLGNLGSARLTARFGSVALAAFGIVNFPFIVWGANAWWSGVITPLVQHAIPRGQGLIDLTLVLGLGGGNLDWYSRSAMALLAALLVAYVVWFRGLWRAGVILAGLLYFVSTRALDGYWLEIAPLWIAAVVVPGPEPDPAPLPWWPPRRKSLQVVLATALFAPTLAFLGLALSATSPLQLRIQSVNVESALQGVWKVSVRVTNRTAGPVRPHFALDTNGQLSPYWAVESGPAVLLGGETAVYALRSPNPQANLAVTAYFVVSAVSASPDAISTSQVFQAVHRRIVLTPRKVIAPIPTGHTILFEAQIENAAGVPLSIVGIPVAMRQSAGGEGGRLRATASINGAPTTRGTVTALTDDQGVATFRVRGFVPAGTGSASLFFRTWISSKHSYSYGYSNIVEVTWSSPTVTDVS